MRKTRKMSSAVSFMNACSARHRWTASSAKIENVGTKSSSHLPNHNGLIKSVQGNSVGENNFKKMSKRRRAVGNVTVKKFYDGGRLHEVCHYFWSPGNWTEVLTLYSEIHPYLSFVAL